MVWSPDVSNGFPTSIFCPPLEVCEYFWRIFIGNPTRRRVKTKQKTEKPESENHCPWNAQVRPQGACNRAESPPNPRSPILRFSIFKYYCKIFSSIIFWKSTFLAFFRPKQPCMVKKSIRTQNESFSKFNLKTKTNLKKWFSTVYGRFRRIQGIFLRIWEISAKFEANFSFLP